MADGGRAPVRSAGERQSDRQDRASYDGWMVPVKWRLLVSVIEVRDDCIFQR